MSTGVESINLQATNDADKYVIIICPKIRDDEELTNCTLKIPDADLTIVYSSDNFSMPGIEYIPDYYPNGQSCTFRLYWANLLRAGKKNTLQLLGKNWEVLAYTTKKHLTTPQQHGSIYKKLLRMGLG